jgi:cell volume regulation protein A
MGDLNTVVALGGALLLLGVVASKVSVRLGVPALLLFLGVGMLAGVDGPGGIAFDDVGLALNIGVVALAFILFSGGLDTEWRDARTVLAPGMVMATAGVAITAAIVGVVAAVALDLPWSTGLLLGAIVSSTDAAAVFTILRSRAIGLRPRIRHLLELESGSNDPMAAFLTIALLEFALGDVSAVGLVPLFAAQMGVGALVGYVVARLAVEGINRLRLEFEGLYPVVTVALVGVVYGLTALAGGSGFLAVYVAGLVLGNSHVVHRRSLGRFHDAVAWLAQIAMFLVLGLLVSPSALVDVVVPALVVAAVLIFVARPLAVALCLAPARFTGREITMVGWVGLRGAVPIILATFPLEAGLPGADVLFNVVFFVVLVSVVVQGTTLPVVAGWLGVTGPVPTAPAYPIESVAHPDAGAALHEVNVPAGSRAERCRVFELGLPPDVLIVLIDRDGDVIVPRGETTITAGDKLMVLADLDDLSIVRARLSAQ